MSIKRVNADWQKLVLQTLWREDTLSGLIERMNDDHASKDQKRENEGQLRIYANRATAMEAITRCKPLSAMLAKDGSVWIAYRPTKEEYVTDTAKPILRSWSRSALQLLELHFDDASGQLVSHICWFAPISVSVSDKMTLGSTQELNLHVNQFLLLLPRLGADEEYQNMFYAIGSKWTERVAGGSFEQPQLPRELFKDWQTLK